MNKKTMVVVSIIAILLLAGCTAGPNNVVTILEVIKEPAGFWLGVGGVFGGGVKGVL